MPAVATRIWDGDTWEAPTSIFDSAVTHVPIAALTPNFNIEVGEPGTLLTGTSTCPAGGTIDAWEWELTSKPVGSSATLVGTGGTRTLTPDEEGDYGVRVRVTCSHGTVSEWHPGRIYTGYVDDPSEPVDIKGEGSTIETALAENPNVLWAMNFESSSWPSVVGVTVSGHTDNEARANYGVGGLGSQLRVRAVADEDYGTHRIINLEDVGVEELEEAYLRYEVWFPSGYVWHNGIQDVHGKLPGLAGKSQDPDWAIPGGGKRYNGSTELLTDSVLQQADCWSARLMFHVGRRVKDYLYVPQPVGTKTSTPPRVYGAHTFASSGGTDLFLNDNDEINTLEQHVVLNTPGVADGVHQVWVNGVLGIDRDNVMYRGTGKSDVKINRVWLTWFYGGGPDDYPDVDSYVRFDNFVLSTAYIGERA